jgi:hypothetical protein
MAAQPLFLGFPLIGGKRPAITPCRIALSYRLIKQRFDRSERNQVGHASESCCRGAERRMDGEAN